MSNPFRDNGGRLPSAFNRNTFATRAEWNIIDMLTKPFTAPFKPDRRPIVKIRRNIYTIFGAIIFKEWRWKCRLCPTRGSTIMWRSAIKAANNHARNHHRSGK